MYWNVSRKHSHEQIDAEQLMDISSSLHCIAIQDVIPPWYSVIRSWHFSLAQLIAALPEKFWSRDQRCLIMDLWMLNDPPVGILHLGLWQSDLMRSNYGKKGCSPLGSNRAANRSNPGSWMVLQQLPKMSRKRTKSSKWAPQTPPSCSMGSHECYNAWEKISDVSRDTKVLFDVLRGCRFTQFLEIPESLLVRIR